MSSHSRYVTIRRYPGEKIRSVEYPGGEDLIRVVNIRVEDSKIEDLEVEDPGESVDEDPGD